jgi:hypothetical protein
MNNFFRLKLKISARLDALTHIHIQIVTRLVLNGCLITFLKAFVPLEIFLAYNVSDWKGRLSTTVCYTELAKQFFSAFHQSATTASAKNDPEGNGG